MDHLNRKIALVLEYDGTEYSGFQLQNNAPSVQGEVENAWTSLMGVSSRLKAAGRTDAGVHATGQVVAFETASDLDEVRIGRGLNHYLPDTIAVTAARFVPDNFDPRRQALSRVYEYSLLCTASRSPIRNRYTYLINRTVDLDLMRQALIYLEGERNFAAFSGAIPLGKNTVRTLFRTNVTGDFDEIRIELEANAFLPQQVRRIVGAVLEVGFKRRSPENFRNLADSHVQGCAQWVIPAQGLCLRKVKYREIEFTDYARN